MSDQTNQQDINTKALELLKNAEASEWVLMKAEELGELQDLANTTLLALVSMNWYQRLTMFKDVYKQYLIQCREIKEKHAVLQEKFNEQLSKGE